MIEIGGHLLNDYYIIPMEYMQKPLLHLKFIIYLGDKTFKQDSILTILLYNIIYWWVVLILKCVCMYVCIYFNKHICEKNP